MNNSVLMLVMYVVSVILLVVGLTMTLVSTKYKTDQAPRFPVWNIAKWRPLWRCREWFTPKGYRMCWIGNIMAGIGVVLFIIGTILD